MSGRHAVIVGGSIAGLFAAAAVAGQFDRITVLDRDELGQDPLPRKGVPQGRQIHILLPIGEEVMGDLLPGVRAELVEAGCREYNHGADIPALTAVGWLPRVKSKAMEAKGYRRPLLEWVVRKRVADLANVEFRQGAVTGLLVDGSRSRITGVTVKDAPSIEADLVIDAGGRGTKSPKWFEELGFGQPEETEVRIYIGYATQYVKLSEGAFEAGARGVGTYPQPAQPVGGAILPADNGVAAVAAFGMMKHYPPADREGLIEFLSGAPSPLIAEIYRNSEPVSEIHTYHMPGNLRRRWEDLDGRPGRFVALGDAAASLNPIYGQGITMAAFGAKYLRDALETRAGDLNGVSELAQRQLGEKIDVAFGISAGGDLAYEGVELENFERPDEDAMLRVGRLWELAAENDVEVMEALAEANFGMRPEALERPSIRAKAESQPSGKSREVDPSKYPETVFAEGGRQDSGVPVTVDG